MSTMYIFGLLNTIYQSKKIISLVLKESVILVYKKYSNQ